MNNLGPLAFGYGLMIEISFGRLVVKCVKVFCSIDTTQLINARYRV